MHETRRSIMPKIEISMLLEELNSGEVDQFMKNGKITTNVSTSSNETIITSSTEVSVSDNSTSSENPTTELIKDVNDYESELESETSTTIIPEDFTEPPAPAKPMLLSEFANHLAAGIKSNQKESFPTPTTPVFTTPPDETFPYMVSAAKEFIRRYLSPEQWRKLRLLLKTIKEVGGSRIDIHRAATLFISKVISQSEMDEITKRKRELFNTFNRRYFNRANYQKKHL